MSASLPAVTSQLEPELATKLIKILGMTGSAHDGEVLAAARKANELLKAHNLSWYDILLPASTAPELDEDFGEWRDSAARCYARRSDLNDRDREFIERIVTWRSPPSVLQREWLGDVYRKLFGETA